MINAQAVIAVDHDIINLQFGKPHGLTMVLAGAWPTAFAAFPAQPHLAEQFTLREQVQLLVNQSEAGRQGMITDEQGAGRVIWQLQGLERG